MSFATGLGITRMLARRGSIYAATTDVHVECETRGNCEPI